MKGISQRVLRLLSMLCLIKIQCDKIKTCKIFTRNHKSMWKSRSQESLRIHLSVRNYSHHCVPQSSLFPFRETLGYLTLVIQLHLDTQGHYLWVKPPWLSQLPRDSLAKNSLKLVPACFNRAREWGHSNSCNDLGPGSLLYSYSCSNWL